MTEAQAAPAAQAAPVYATVTLPSKGYLYGEKLPGGDLRVKPISGREEKLLAGSSTSQEEIVSQILQRCIVDSAITPDEMLVGDRFYLLMTLRANSYGAEYGFQYRCESCRLQFRHSIDITEDLELKEFEEGVEEPFKVTLPRSGDSVGFRLLRGKDEKAVQKNSDSHYQKMQGDDVGDPAYNYRPARQIQYINEQKFGQASTFNQAITYLENMVGEDSMFLREEMNEVDVGINIMIDINCPRCGAQEEISLPFGPEFFRPRRKRKD
jgi:hypothetical protein